jgi:hypothetical protein
MFLSVNGSPAMTELEGTAFAAVFSSPARKADLKKTLAANLHRLFRERDLKVKDVAELLAARGADINQFAVRAWLRQSELRPTLPSCQNLVYLSELLGVGIGELLGQNTPQDSTGSFYRKLREGENGFERDVLDTMEKMRADYADAANGSGYVQNPLRCSGGAGEGAPPDAEALLETDKKAGYYLLSNDLVRINPDAVRRDTALETELARAWEGKNGSILDDACVWILPNRIPGSDVSLSGIAEAVFLRCAAQYLAENVIKSGCTIGIAGGRSMAGLLKMLPRSGSLSGCNFFPLLRPSSLFADAAVGSTAIISDLLFRFGDLSVRMPDDIDLEDTVNTLLDVADAVVFTLGTTGRSSVSRILRRVRRTASAEEQEKLSEMLAGDILFHFFTKSGYTLEEVAEQNIAAPEMVKNLARELVGPDVPVLQPGDNALRFVQTREAYTRHIAGVRPSLERIKNHAKKPNRRTILTIAGIDKLGILKIFRDRVCESRMHLTLITEQSLAHEMLKSLKGSA